jgi:hypothetical protein
VRIIDLGDFSVTYRVSGLLEDPKFLITTRSRLYGSILDVLHGDGVEIMSPTFMNQRRLPEESKTIPPIEWKTASDGPEETGIETIAFDKAEQAGELEKEKRRIMAEIQEAQAGLKEAADDRKEEIKASLARAKERLGEIEIEQGHIKSEAESDGEADSRPATEKEGE